MDRYVWEGQVRHSAHLQSANPVNELDAAALSASLGRAMDAAGWMGLNSAILLITRRFCLIFILLAQRECKNI